MGSATAMRYSLPAPALTTERSRGKLDTSRSPGMLSAVVSAGKRSLRKTPLSLVSFSKTKTRRGSSLWNSHRPSEGAVQRYQVVAAANPNHSPGSRVAPRLLPWTMPAGPSIGLASDRLSLAGRPPLAQRSSRAAPLASLLTRMR